MIFSSLFLNKIIILFIFLIFFLCIYIVTIFKKTQKNDQILEKNSEDLKKEYESMYKKIHGDISELHMFFDSKIERTTNTLQSNMSSQARESIRIIQDVTEKLTRLDETNKRVIEVSSSIRELQDILKNPKQRGVLGEYYLETLLSNVLPPHSYQCQYSFSNGDTVDAIIRVKNALIPIDSKFSLENYNKIIECKDSLEKEKYEKVFINDLKQRITETAKYIRPEEGTLDFAFMFIPHEALYYDLLINKVGAIKEDTENLIQRAAGKHKVIIVSPTSFLAYLQTVLQGLKALKIEEDAQAIIKRVEDLRKHLEAFEMYYEKVGSSLSQVVNVYNKSVKEMQKIDKDVYKISGETHESFLKEVSSQSE